MTETAWSGSDVYFVDRDPPPPPSTTSTQEPEPEPVDPDPESKLVVNDEPIARKIEQTNEDEEDEIPVVTDKRYYVINKPPFGSSSSVLYFSVRGLDNDNDFILRVYNETVRDSAKRLSSSLSLAVLTTLVVSFINLF